MPRCHVGLFSISRPCYGLSGSDRLPPCIADARPPCARKAGVARELPRYLPLAYPYSDEALDLEATLRDKMREVRAFVC